LELVLFCSRFHDNSSATFIPKQALQIALKGASAVKCGTELIDLNDYHMEFCDGLDCQSKYRPVPPDILKLRNKLKQAKGIILATPEYHNSYSGVLKNFLDWMVVVCPMTALIL